MPTLTTVRSFLTAATTAAALAFAPSAAAAESVPFGGDVRFVGDTVVTTVEVPIPSPLQPDYVARAYQYDVYGSCWRGGTELIEQRQDIGGGRVPSSAGDYELRIPPSTQTTFTFSEPIEQLLHPPTPLAPIVCPKGATPGLQRIHITDLHVYASSLGTLDRPVDVEYSFPPPVSSESKAKRKDKSGKATRAEKLRKLGTADKRAVLGDD